MAYIAGHGLVFLHHPLVLLVDIQDLPYPLGGLFGQGRGGEGMVVRGDIGHDGSLVRLGGIMDVWIGGRGGERGRGEDAIDIHFVNHT